MLDSSKGIPVCFNREDIVRFWSYGEHGKVLVLLFDEVATQDFLPQFCRWEGVEFVSGLWSPYFFAFLTF